MSNQERLFYVKQFLMNYLQNNKQTFQLKQQVCEGNTHNYTEFVMNLGRSLIDNKYHIKFIPSTVKLSDIYFTSAWNIDSISMYCKGKLRIPVKLIANNETYTYLAGVPVDLNIYGVTDGNWNFVATIRSCTPDKSMGWWGGRKTRKARYISKKRRSTRGRSH